MKISRRFNYTNRQKLNSSEAKFAVIDNETGSAQFDVDFSFSNKKIPADARLFVEAKCNNTVQRFDFGTYECPVTPDSTLLDQIDLSGTLIFTVKIVDDADGIARLIASGRFKPAGDDEEENKDSIMVFKAKDLGSETWQMEFNEGEKPVLLINSKIPEAKDKLMRNSIFQGLILPAALRESLLYFLRGTEEPTEDDPIAKNWLDLAEFYALNKRPDKSSDYLEIQEWVNEVSSEFSKHFSFCGNLIQSMEEDNK